MAYPVGYTQAANGYWYKDSDASGPYALGPTGALFLVGDGVVGSGSFTQGKNGFWYAADGDNSGPYALGPDGLFYLLGGSGGMPITDLELIIPGSSPQEELVLSANADGALVLTPTDYANTEITGLSIPHYLNTPTNFAFLELMADGDVATLEVKTGGTPPTLNLAVTAQSLYGTARIAAFSGGVIEAYNLGVPGDANYERLRMDWSSNVARIWTQNDGSGSARSLRVGAASADGATAPVAYTQWNNGALPVIQHTLTSGAPNTGTWSELASTGTGLSAASGTQTAVAISPTFAQTSTAAGIALLVNPSGTFGSGGGKLQSWQLASSEVGAMTSSGAMYAGSFRTLLDFGFAATVGGSTDLTLIRDAADTLALRRSTNAQTFRVYNTYTDASNNEWGGINWNTNTMFVGTVANGTGTARDMALVRGSSTALTLTSSAMIALPAGTTAKSQINFAASTAPSSPANGDMWVTASDIFIRLGGVTYTITKV